MDIDENFIVFLLLATTTFIAIAVHQAFFPAKIVLYREQVQKSMRFKSPLVMDVASKNVLCDIVGDACDNGMEGVLVFRRQILY